MNQPTIAPFRWSLERVSPHDFRASCFWCGRVFSVGIVAPVFRAGPEVIGYMCGECVPPQTRQLMTERAAHLRGEATR